jgi:hypothetical protein
MKKTKLYGFLVLFLVSLFMVNAGMRVTLNTPTTGINQTSLSGTFNVSVVGNYSNYVCQLWTNVTGSWAKTAEKSVSNSTNFTFSHTLAVSTTSWNTFCYAKPLYVNYSVDLQNWSSSNKTINVLTYPVVIVSPTSGYFNDTSKTITINATPLGQLHTCVLYADGVTNKTNTSITQVTSYALGFTEGTHKVSAWCNNTAGLQTTTVNYTIVIDRTQPTAFSCLSPSNNTRQADNTPTLLWNVSTDGNFSNYTLSYSNDSSFTTKTDIAISTASTVTYTLSALDWDTQYYWYVRAFDLAGNIRQGTNCGTNAKFQYKPMFYCSTLNAGWNLCGWTRDASMNASYLSNELGSTISQIAKFNSSKAFQTYVVGESANADMNINRQDAVFIYADSSTAWTNNTFTTNATLGNFAFTNASADPWTVFPVLLPEGIGYPVNLTMVDPTSNLTACAFYNNTAQEYIPFWKNTSVNLNTPLRMGNVLWCDLNTTKSSWSYVRSI